MLEDKVISENSYETAKAEKIETVQKDEIKNNYAETFTYYCATRALMELEGFEFQTVFSDDAEKEAYDREYQTLYDECNAKLFTGRLPHLYLTGSGGAEPAAGIDRLYFRWL